MAKLCRALFLAALGLIALAGGLATLWYPFLVLLLGAVWLWPRRGRPRPSTSHGSATVCDLGRLTQAGMIGEDDGQSLVVGRASFTNPPTRGQAVRQLLSPHVPSELACRSALAAFKNRPGDEFIRIRDFVNLITCAPAGAGKSAMMIGNVLKSYTGSTVIVDPKGEHWRNSAAHRERVLGHRCIRLDPFGIAGPVETSHALNPFDFIAPNSPEFAEQVQMLVRAVVVQDDKQQPHWNAKAVEMLSAFCYWVCATEDDPSKRNLASTVDILSNKLAYQAALEDMRQVVDFGGVVRKAGSRLTWTENKELGSVASTLFRHLDWLMSPPVVAGLARTTFDPRWLWDGKTDVYICVPHDRLKALAGLVRLWLGTIMELIGHSGDEQHKVLFIVDECGHLGHQESIENAASLMRSYGVRLWLFFQSLEQLRTCYGDQAQKILDNCGHQMFFGLSSYDTGEVVSKRIGDSTVLVESINNNASRSHSTGGGGREQSQGNISSGTSTTISEAARRLFKPEEILTLPSDCMLMFAKNLPVIPVKLVRHFADPAFLRGGTGRDRKPGPAVLWLAMMQLLAATLILIGVLNLPGLLGQAAPPHPSPAQRAHPVPPVPAEAVWPERFPLPAPGGMGSPDVAPWRRRPFGGAYPAPARPEPGMFGSLERR